MNLQSFVGQNWSRTFSIWIEGIQVQFPPVAGLKPGSGGLLARVRSVTRLAATLVLPFFCLHCARPQLAKTARPVAGFQIPTTPGKTSGPLVYTEAGMASWYGGAGDGFTGLRTAGGDRLDPSALTCAHRTLPFNTLVEVENLDNGRRAVLRVNDRGPFLRGRVLDVTYEAARQLDFLACGTARIIFREVPREALRAPAPMADALEEPSRFPFIQEALELVFGPSAYQRALSPDGGVASLLRAGTFLFRTEAGKMPDEPVGPLPPTEPFLRRRT